VNVGERYSLTYKQYHRVEAEIVELTPDYVIVDAVHRCPPTCYLLQMRKTLPIEGRRQNYTYRDFAKLFTRLNPDAIALPK
jgi:hypothetical protein